MKNQTEITVRLPEELLRKMLFIANAEGRSLNNHILMMMRSNAQYFERTKGRITPLELQAVSLEEKSED
ncbi:MAG: Arc family DNA-binding protein [Ruminococcaceae bacterium]|nr:Arc family DNA-binding protein [Oscillospiraceae bacterium]